MELLKEGKQEGITYKICECRNCNAVYKVQRKDTGRIDICSDERFWICPNCYTRNNWEQNNNYNIQEA